MYVSRMNFHLLPGKTGDLEKELGHLSDMVKQAGGDHCRILRTHFASPGAPDMVFEQEVENIGDLESQISQVTDSREFQEWSSRVSSLLSQSPHREVYSVR